jgi:hypothetical protein
VWKQRAVADPSHEHCSRRTIIPTGYPPSEVPCLLIWTSLSAVSTPVMTKTMIVPSKREEQNNHQTSPEDKPALLEAT